MATGFKISRRFLLGLGRVLLIVGVVAVVAWSLLRGGDDDVTPTKPETTLEGPTDLPTVYPTPDFTLPSIPPLDTGPHGTWEFVGATANLFSGMSYGAAIADVNRLAQDSSIIGINEVTRPRAGELRSWAAANGWTFFSPTSPTNPWQGFNGVLVKDKDFKVLDKGVLYGSRASMPAYKINSRWITWTLLLHKKSKTPLAWIQTHMDANVEAGGRPKAGAGARINNNLTYMKALSDTIAKFVPQAEVIVGGDWNVDAYGDSQVRFGGFPYVAIQGSGSEETLPGLRSIYTDLGFKQPATSGRAWIDYLLTWKRTPENRILSVKDYRILAPVNSDHNPVQAIFRITK